MTGPADAPRAAPSHRGEATRAGEAGKDEWTHAANVLGGLAVGVVDAQSHALRDAAGGDLSAASALTTLLDRPGLTIDALARVLGLTHSGSVRLADRLARRGLLERATGVDRRTASLRLTDAGRERAVLVLNARRQVLRRLLAPLDEPQRSQLLDLAGLVAEQLVQDRAQARRVCRHCEHACCRDAACPIGSAADAR